MLSKVSSSAYDACQFADGLRSAHSSFRDQPSPHCSHAAVFTPLMNELRLARDLLMRLTEDGSCASSAAISPSDKLSKPVHTSRKSAKPTTASHRDGTLNLRHGGCGWIRAAAAPPSVAVRVSSEPIARPTTGMATPQALKARAYFFSGRKAHTTESPPGRRTARARRSSGGRLGRPAIGVLHRWVWHVLRVEDYWGIQFASSRARLVEPTGSRS